MQWGNYNGTPKHTITLLEGIRSAMGENDKLIYEQRLQLGGALINQKRFSASVLLKKVQDSPPAIGTTRNMKEMR